MGYSTFKSEPKSKTQSEDVGKGQIALEHLDTGLFGEIKKIGSHSHKGAGSRRIDIADLFGSFLARGFYIYSSDGTKKYNVTVDSGTDAFVLTEV